MRHLSIVLLICILQMPRVDAQDQWIPADNGLVGAEAMTIVVARDGSVIAGMVGGIYRSTDDSTWIQLPAAGVRFASLILSFSESTIIVQGEMDLHRSTDNGATWETSASRLPDRGFIRLLVADSSGGLLGVAEPRSGRGASLVRSTDTGRTWSVLDAPIASRISSRPGITTAGGDILVAGNGEIFRSTDLGITWDSIALSARPLECGFALVDDSTIIAAAENGIYHSSDQGLTWVHVDGRVVSAFAGRGNDLFAVEEGSRDEDSRLLHSTDRGVTWVVSGRGAGSALTGWAIALTQRGNLVGSDGDRLIRSSNQGGTWVDATAGIRSFRLPAFAIDASNTLFATKGWFGEKSFVISRNDGRSWTSSHLDEIDIPVYLVATRGGDLLLSRSFGWGYGRIERSTDNGVSWSTVADSTVGPIHSVAYGSDDAMFAGTGLDGGFGSYEGSIYRSNDDGLTWMDLDFKKPVAALWMHRDGDLLAAAYLVQDTGPLFSGSLWRSNSDYTAWNVVDDTLALTSLVGNGSGMIFGGGNGRAYRSSDGGSTWDSSPFPIETTGGITTMVIDSNGVLFAGTYRGGVFRSSDHGVSWSEFNDGILSRTIINMVVSPLNVVYLVTDDNGLYRLARRNLSSPSEPELGLRITPNPASGFITISASVPHVARLDVRVYNTIGHEVATVAVADRSVGIHRFSFDSSILENGIYLVVARIGKEVTVERLVTVH